MGTDRLCAEVPVHEQLPSGGSSCPWGNDAGHGRPFVAVASHCHFSCRCRLLLLLLLLLFIVEGRKCLPTPGCVSLPIANPRCVVGAFPMLSNSTFRHSWKVSQPNGHLASRLPS